MACSQRRRQAQRDDLGRGPKTLRWWQSRTFKEELAGPNPLYLRFIPAVRGKIYSPERNPLYKESIASQPSRKRSNRSRSR